MSLLSGRLVELSYLSLFKLPPTMCDFKNQTALELLSESFYFGFYFVISLHYHMDGV